MQQKIIYGAITSVLICFLVWSGFNKVDYKNQIAKQDLRLKCQEVYSKLRTDFEVQRYGSGVRSADAVIWSPKTETCLVYYNVPKDDIYSFLFEVWDYTNSDLVLSYRSELSGSCSQNGMNISMQKLLYKYDKNLEGQGCDFFLMKDGIDLLNNFEKAMLELGFKK